MSRTEFATFHKVVATMEDNVSEPVVVPATAKKEAPIIQARLRHKILKMPEESWKASGIRIFGRKIRSLVYTTDLAIIKNCDADAVFAVYPFTPQQSISEAIIDAASIPVFCGIGGGTTRGVRTVTLAHDVECQGAMGVVLNSPISNVNLRAVSLAIDIPTVITVVSADADVAARIDAGAAIINVAGGKETANIVSKIREKFPDVPIIASSGGTEESTRLTIEAGANAVTYTPPAPAILFKQMMAQYRSSTTPPEQPQHTALEVLQAAGLWHDQHDRRQ
ncbi:hypothetical protein [Olsenella sp. Marseille-P4559]|uniref:hypothetical protein n=1 Tax=Olsenella sp. Marseille-P4559 TaxID=2364795 RepID=UPI001A910A40|nr:hypothetical protein [Olsenella sp. Marseille-P4559]